MINKNIAIIEYSKTVDLWNTITHALGSVFIVPASVFMLLKAEGGREKLSVLIYCLSFFAVYTVSSVYHALRDSEKKRKWRLLDHSTVPILIAGTATPCALITLYNVSSFHSLLVFCLAWGCSLFGLFSKLFFFEKLKSVTMAVYIISGAVMLLSVIPIMDKINSGAFMKLVYGCVFYVVGAILCGIGAKKEVFHPIFHVFVLLGSLTHFYVIYNFVI